jgi:hypothetical protein
MLGNRLDFTVSTSNLVAAFAVLISVLTLLLSVRRDRLMKRAQYADHIRGAAALLTAKLERWCNLAFGLLEQIQPIITEADAFIIANCNVVNTRDKFWRDLWLLQVAVSNRILEEEIEIAYVPLYGYDANVRELFLATLDRLKEIRRATESHLLDSTQRDILQYREATPSSAELGNRLRKTCGTIANDYLAQMTEIFNPFRDELLKIIEADDSAITKKEIPLKKAQELFPSAAATVSSTEEVIAEYCYEGLLRPISPTWNGVRILSIPKYRLQSAPKYHSPLCKDELPKKK